MTLNNNVDQSHQAKKDGVNVIRIKNIESIACERDSNSSSIDGHPGLLM